MRRARSAASASGLRISRASPWATQRLQIAIQNRVIDPVLSGSATLRVPWIVRVMQRLPFLQAIPARLVGLGFRPEHVDLRVIDGR